MAINELDSICRQLYFHLLKGRLRKRTRDDLGISIANLLESSIQFTDSNNFITDDVDHTIIELIKERGYVYLENLLSDEDIEALKTYFHFKQLEYSIKGEKSHGLFHKIPKEVGSAYYSQTDIQLCPIFYKIAHNPWLISIAENYLGAPPTIGTIASWWTFQSEEVSVNQLFHHDRDDFRALKLFVYLTDVDENNGAHVYVEKSHEYDILKRYANSKFSDNIKLENLFWQWVEKHRKKDVEIETFFDKSMIKTHVGKQGTTFFEDTRGFHKGSPLLKGKRWLFQMLYTLVPVVPFSVSQEYKLVKRSDVQGYSNILLNDKVKFSTRMYYVD
ncbi:hypothetical protein CMK22_03065 [Candidatus Poribacteria bacterium]|nr:hypothetical protein [Candidatus Poribacteria bacterium]